MPNILTSLITSIRQTHELDPAVKVPDGSHMDIVQGFKPERWLNESTKPTEYMPFGYGPRYVIFLWFASLHSEARCSRHLFS